VEVNLAPAAAPTNATVAMARSCSAICQGGCCGDVARLLLSGFTVSGPVRFSSGLAVSAFGMCGLGSKYKNYFY
jgi:hypothetical protein